LINLRETLSWLTGQLKKPWIWLAMMIGAALSLIIYQEVLLKIWGFYSLRVKLSFFAAFVVLSAACLLIEERFLLPRLKLLTRSQRLGALVLSLAAVPAVMAVAVLSPRDFQGKFIYFLLPTHTIQIEALTANNQGNGSIALTGFHTQAQGAQSYNSLKVRGWERRGDELVLINPADNQLSWRGKPGEKATLLFRTLSGSAEINVAWDGNALIYSLDTDGSQGVNVARKFQVPLYASWLGTAIAMYLSIVFLALIFSVGSLSLGGMTAEASRKKMGWLTYAIPMYLVWSVYLLVFWPGFMSRDSITQWQEMVAGKGLDAAISVAYTLSMWLITRLWYSPAAIAIVQILALGGVLGWGIATLRENGAPAWLAWLTTILLAISPANSALSITLLKDILFSTCVVALTILFFKIVVTRGVWLNQKTAWISLGITLTLISLYRLNGTFVAFGSLLMLTWFYRVYWRSLVKAAGVCLVIYTLFMGPLYRMLNVQSESRARYQLVMANLLAAHMDAGTYFSPEAQAILKPVISEYPFPYDCSRNSDLIFNRNLDREYLIKHTRELMEITFKVTQENPWVTLQHFACQGDFVYRIPQEHLTELGFLSIAENNYGLRQTSMLPALYPPLWKFLNPFIENENPDIIWFSWRMPFWMYVCGFGCIIFCLRNKTWRPLLVLAPGFFTASPYFILTLGPIFRYIYSMYLIGILFSGYFWLCAFFKTQSANE
jgi:hypothetical protein